MLRVASHLTVCSLKLGINQDFYSDRPILEELGKWFQFVMAQNNQNAQNKL